MYRQLEKNLLNSNISSTCPHNMVYVGTLTAEIDEQVWGTQANVKGFDVLALLLQRCRSPEASPFLAWYTMYTFFGGFCPLTEFCQVQTPLCIQVLHSTILAALLHGSRPLGTSQTLWRGTKSGIMELLQRAPPIFSWAAITLGIGPHSS